MSSGETLSAAFRRALGIFPRMFVDMLEVGEKVGQLARGTGTAGHFYEHEAKMRGDIRQALGLPDRRLQLRPHGDGIILFVVLPIFADLFADLGAELPWITRIGAWRFGDFGPATSSSSCRCCACGLGASPLAEDRIGAAGARTVHFAHARRRAVS